MNEFDIKAIGWDINPMHLERSEVIAKQILERILVQPWMIALEYGAGTGITSFLLKNYLKEITMMDSSVEMVRIMTEKVNSSKAGNLKPLLFNLEEDHWNGNRFDLIMNQMVLHHVAYIENIIRRFHQLLNPGGYLAVADLYPEDGSFHGEGFNGHKGFDTIELERLIIKNGFKDISIRKCFVINKKVNESETKQFDVFLLIATRS